MAPFTVPKHQIAAVRVGKGETARAPAKEIEVDLPGPNEILVKINWTGLCGSDEALIRDGWAETGVVMQPESKGIAGHEGAGVVVAVGDAMHHKWKIGDRAGIKWIWSICGECDFCTGGDELFCTKQLDTAVNVPGTFQQYALSDGRYTSRIPDGVPDEEAGPIMCGGVTAYSGVKRAGLRAGQWIVISGAGGGLGHLAVQYARAMGLRVIAIDAGQAKEELCKKLGAEAFVDFGKVEDIASEIKKITSHGAHGVVVTALTKEAYDIAPSLLRPNGTLVVVGLPHNSSVKVAATPSELVFGCLHVVGSLVGTLKEVEEALDFTARGLVHPVVTTGKLEDVDKYIELMAAGKVAGRVSLKCS